MEKPSKETLEQWRKDPNYGMGRGYFNKDDKRIFVPGKDDFGWSPNFANPKSILVFCIILVFSFLISDFLKRR